MNTSYPIRLSSHAAVLAAALSLHAAERFVCERFVWTEGHGDLAVNYLNGQWRWNVENGRKVHEVIIRLDDVTRRAIPGDPAFSFLGGEGAPIWIIGAHQTPGVPNLGISAEATPAGTFVGDRFELRLDSVGGPGDFFMWTTSGTGAPTLLMNSRDGITTADKADVPAGGHFHQNWGFNAPGTYRVGFRASGTPSNHATAVTSDAAIYTFEVNVLKQGEADVEITYEDGSLEFHVHDESTDGEFHPAHVALQAGPASWQTAPASAAFAFLGQGGAPLYVLPQTQTPGVLFLGLAAGEVAAGVFAEDTLTVELVGVEGPGHLFYYTVDGFGAPSVFFNSADGIDATDVVSVAAGSHAHRNWAFSEPGVYRVTLRARGTLTSGAEVRSDPARLWFEVLPPAFIEQGEIDVEIAFNDVEAALALALHEDAVGQEHCPQETVLVASAASRRTVPDDARFDFLGAPGRTVFILPQDESEDVLFLGLAADEIPDGAFAGNFVNLRLVSLDGPGHLALYTTDSFGAPTLFWNSADGLDERDVFRAEVGSHLHANWAFSAPGVYRVGLQASGVLAASERRVASDVMPLTFLVPGDVASSSPPTLMAKLVDDGARLQLAWQSRPGAAYQLQSRLALESGAWTNEGPAISGDGSLQTATVPRGNEVMKLFRLVEQ